LQTVTPIDGNVVVRGYGLRIAVERGHLSVEDGIGGNRRRFRFSRVDRELRRLVVIGHSGTVTLDALRWLNDVGATFVHVDHDGNVIVASGPCGLDDARLRRTQAIALTNEVGLEVAKTLICQKLYNQADLLRNQFKADDQILAIRSLRAQAENASTLDELRVFEARAGAAYWQTWRGEPVRFTKPDAPRIPEHWLMFGTRHSPISKPSPRRAGNPANALLNYAYAILEAEARIAALAVGLDPAIGVMHLDARARDSLACDIMEPVRPQVDTFVLGMIRKRLFQKSDFFETREGVCRLMPSISQKLVSQASHFTAGITRVAQAVAKTLTRRDEAKQRGDLAPHSNECEQRPLRIISDAVQEKSSRLKASAGLRMSKLQELKRRYQGLPCQCCGKPIDGYHRSYCEACRQPGLS